MSLQPDTWIREMAQKQRMIEPFCEQPKSDSVISFGLSSYGYDIRLSDEFKIFHPLADEIFDPKDKAKPRFFKDHKGESCVIPPNSFVLGKSLEYFRIPENVLGLAIGKSTYARCGVMVNITPLEPGWEGFLTIDISNTSPQPVKIYSGEGIAQVVFLKAVKKCARSYRDKGGRYQAQAGIALSRVKRV